MGKLFGNLTTEGTEKVEDRLGGGRHVFSTDVYENVTSKMAYMGKFPSGAMYITWIFDINGQELEITETITNKKGQNTYEKDGKKNQLPGFVTVNDLCLTITGQELSDQDTEERQIEIWSYEDKKKVRQARDVLVDVIGKPASLAVRKILKNKQKKVEGSDKYEDIADEITVNDVYKSFHVESRRTVAEIKNGKEDAEFIDAWKDKWGGKDIDQRSIKDGKGGGSASGAPKASAGGDKPKTSLFS